MNLEELYLFVPLKKVGIIFRNSLRRCKYMDLNQIKMLKSDLDCSYEIGIWSEIDSFLECREEYILEKKSAIYKKKNNI